MKKIINTTNAPEPIGPYNQAVLVNDTLYVSGQIPINPTWNKLVDTSIEAETHQVMENIEAILKAAGMRFEHVVKCSIFVKDLSNFSAVNEVYGSYFKNNFPARECVEVARLPKDVNVEISCVASF